VGPLPQKRRTLLNESLVTLSLRGVSFRPIADIKKKNFSFENPDLKSIGKKKKLYSIQKEKKKPERESLTLVQLRPEIAREREETFSGGRQWSLSPKVEEELFS